MPLVTLYVVHINNANRNPVTHKHTSTALRNCNHSGAEVSNTPLGGLSIRLSVCFVLMKLILIPLIMMMSSSSRDVDDDYVIVVAAGTAAVASGFPLLLL